jgi:hypothetical protein
MSSFETSIGGMLLGRTLSVLITMTLGTAMAARQGTVAMAAHQICLQVWLAVSLLSDALAVSAQVHLLLFIYFVNTAYFQKYHNYFSIYFGFRPWFHLKNWVNFSSNNICGNVFATISKKKSQFTMCFLKLSFSMVTTT